MALSRFILPFADVGSGIRPSANSQMFFYATGTTTPKDTFNCPDGTTANSNPVVSDINGLFPDIFVTGTYKVVLQDKNGDQQWEADPVTSSLVSELDVIARSLNVEDGQVIYSADTTTVLDNVLYIYDPAQQKTWSKPSDVGAGETIITLSINGDLTTTGGVYEMTITSTSNTSVNVSSYGAKENTDISAQITAALDSMGQIGKLTLNPGNYIINSDVLFLERGRPDNGVFEVDFSGCVFTGTGNFIFDSCKNLSVIGVQAPNQNIILRGVWYSDFKLCKSSELVFNDTDGTSFSSLFWNDFSTCIFQTIRRGAGSGHANSLSFYGTSLRGEIGQGFAQTKDYNLIFEGTGNAQNWMFYGGDISYANVAVYQINTANDLELVFNGVYFDTLTPDIDGLLDNQYVKSVSCHVAGKTFTYAELESALKADQDYSSGAASSGWKSYAPYNIMPNGNLIQRLDSYSAAGGGFIGAFSGATTEVDDPSIGIYLNLSVGAGDATATLCRFRSIDVPMTAKYSGVIIARNNAVGDRALNFSVGGEFFDATIRDEWTIVSIAAQSPLTAGAFSEILMRSTDGSGYDIDVRYVGLHIGTAPPAMCHQHPNTTAHETLKTNKLTLGGDTDIFRPFIISGLGSPEGVESAPRGAIYMRGDGGANTSVYVKESGTGNTGWVGK